MNSTMLSMHDVANLLIEAEEMWMSPCFCWKEFGRLVFMARDVYVRECNKAGLVVNPNTWEHCSHAYEDMVAATLCGAAEGWSL